MFFQMITYYPHPHPIPEPSHKEQTDQTTVVSHTVCYITAPRCLLCHLSLLALVWGHLGNHYKYVFYSVCSHFLFQIQAIANGIDKENHTKKYPLAPCPPNSAKQFGQPRTVVLKMWSIMVPKAFGEGGEGQRSQNFYQNITAMLITISTLALAQVYSLPDV